MPLSIGSNATDTLEQDAVVVELEKRNLNPIVRSRRVRNLLDDIFQGPGQ